MPLIPYPDVPALPGVPALMRLTSGIGIVGGAEAIASALGLAGEVSFGNRIYSSILLDSLGSGQLPQYSILYPSVSGGPGLAVVTPDSAVELDYQADSGIMTHPIEEGQFAAYNRVQEPQSIRLMLACQGKYMARSAFLSALAALREGTQLVTIVTPDATYRNMALKGFGYRKSAERGAVTIWADTQWLESRSTGVVVSPAPTSQPEGAATNALGEVQLQPLTTQQLAAVGNPAVAPAPLPARLIEEMPTSGDAF